MGIPEDEAERYEGYVKEGKILVVVERDENRVGLNDNTTTVDGLDSTRTRNPVDAPLTSDNPANTRFDNTRDF